MKKYGGITWWKNNYGSILQAYALNRFINRIPDCNYEVIQQVSFKSFTVNNLISKLKKEGLIKTIKYSLGKFGLPSLRERNKKCEHFIKKNISISKVRYDLSGSEINNYYQGFICGSDQIWNPSFTEPNDIYWLGFANNKSKIAYAPSIGITSASKEYENNVRKCLQSFNAISCRENAGTEYLNRILGEEKCITVLDPTLMIDVKEWNSISSKRIIKEDYIFAYILRGDNSQRDMIKRFAKKRHLKLVTIPFLDPSNIRLSDFGFGDIKIKKASPNDFISLIKNASYVFTDSFHCMIFSCIYQVEFFSIKKDGTNQMLRILDFQKWMGLGNRCIKSEKDINRLINQDYDKMWNCFNSRLKEERERSSDYLISALSE